MQRKNRTVKGFTLAELLIVVAIIAVLVAVSIPTFATQLEKAREARDLSEVRTAAGKVSDAYLVGNTGSEKSSDKYTTVTYNATQKYYEIYVKIEQTKEGWQSNNNEMRFVIAKVEESHKDEDKYYLCADTSKDHWIVRFFEDDQHYEFVCDGTRT